MYQFEEAENSNQNKEVCLGHIRKNNLSYL